MHFQPLFLSLFLPLISSSLSFLFFFSLSSFPVYQFNYFKRCITNTLYMSCRRCSWIIFHLWQEWSFWYIFQETCQQYWAKRQEVFHCINTRELHDNLSKIREMVAVKNRYPMELTYLPLT
jgi:hypothetical protein